METFVIIGSLVFIVLFFGFGFYVVYDEDKKSKDKKDDGS